jgi:branched-chain amino acid transport system ATP-binding protein
LEADVKARLGEPVRATPASPATTSQVAQSGSAPALLDLRKVCAGYGPARVLHGLDLSVNRGETLVVIGRNGSERRR